MLKPCMESAWTAWCHSKVCNSFPPDWLGEVWDLRAMNIPLDSLTAFTIISLKNPVRFLNYNLRHNYPSVGSKLNDLHIEQYKPACISQAWARLTIPGESNSNYYNNHRQTHTHTPKSCPKIH